MYGVDFTRPSFGTISISEQSEILKELAKRASQLKIECKEISEPKHTPKSQIMHEIIPPMTPADTKKLEMSDVKYDDTPESLVSTEETETSNSPNQKTSLKPQKANKNKVDYDSEKELRNTFFRLALLAVVLSFISWIILMLIMLLLNIKCTHLIYCIILEPIMMSNSCIVNDASTHSTSMENRTILMVILTLWVVLISIIYALLWQYFWRSKHNPLWTKHEKDITKLITGFLSLSGDDKSTLIKRTFKIWSMLIFCLSVTLLIEYFVEKYLYFPGGRYLYCLMVLTFGLFLVKIIGFITTYEYKHYHNSMNSPDIYNADNAALIEADSRNCRFHRQCILVMVNTTYALYVPTIRVYPISILNGNVTQQSLEIYLDKLNQSAMEATFFLWSAVISSQLIAFGTEMFNAYVFGSCCLEKNKRTNCCSKMLFVIAACVTMFTAKELYFLHENWFLAVILFYYGVTFSWLNPSIFLIASLSLLFLCMIYKLRFILLNPQMLHHFVPDIIMLETILFILLCAFPTQFLLLLPLYHNCKWISFGGIVIGFILTICVVILYYFIFRIKKLVTKNNSSSISKYER